MERRLTYLSPSAVTLRGYPIEQTLQQPFERILTPASRAPACAAIDQLLAGHEISRIENLELELTRKDATTVWTETTASLVLDAESKPRKIVGVTRDITERKQAEQLREAARREAERLAQIKTDFLANMSHEIRTPLNAVIGLAQIGLRDNQERSTGVTFGRILDSGKHLLGVVNNILDFSKMEAGKLALESCPLPLRAKVEDALEMVKHQASEKSLSLDLDYRPETSEWVMADPLRLQQVILNLLSNAVKFTENGSVKMTVRHEAGEFVFDIEDTGIGMTEEQISRLFRAFEQADTSTTRRYGGSGLGLTIARNLTELMGGHMEVASRPGIGSTFTLRLPLPLASPPSTHPNPDQQAGQRLRGVRLLAAEDVELNRLVLEDLLAHEGAQVVLAADGQQALERLEQEGISAFQAVLMDVQMPVMDGYEAARRISAIAPLLPVIGLTAHALGEEHARCRAAGMADVATKPIDIDVLVKTILQQIAASSAFDPKAARADGDSPKAREPEPGTAPPEVLVDWSALQARFQHRPAMVGKIVRITLDTQTHIPESLRQSAASLDFETLAFLAHNLEGLAGTLASTPLSALAQTLVQAVRERREGVAELTRQAASTLESVLEELREGLEHNRIP